MTGLGRNNGKAPGERDFLLFQGGQFISSLGDTCAEIAVLWWVAEKTGSALQLAAVFAPVSVVRIFLLPLLGPLGDRYSRKSLAVLSDIWRGCISALICALAWTGFFSLPALIALFILSSAGSALFSSVADSMIPQLVGNAGLNKAYRQTSLLNASATIAGGLIGGLITAKFGIVAAFFVDTLSYFAGAGATILITLHYQDKPAARSSFTLSLWFTELKAGARMVSRIPVQLWICGLAAFLNFMISSLTVAFPLLAKSSGTMPVWLIGLLKSGISAGMIAGALSLGALSRKFKSDRLIMAGVGIIGAGLLFLGLGATPAAQCGIMFAIGAGLVIINVPLMSQNNLAIPDQYRSRALSMVMFFNQAFAPAGVLAAGGIIASAGLGFTLAAGGGLVLLAIPAMRLAPEFTKFFRLSAKEAENYFAKTHPHAFETCA
jgi:MFS family permease